MKKLTILCAVLAIAISLDSLAYSEILLEQCTEICTCESPCSLRCKDFDDPHISTCGNYGLCAPCNRFTRR
jgi:hypothetical protein